MARVLQHEIDHLNGVLISDYDPASQVGPRIP
jgi:peptide deformylase